MASQTLLIGNTRGDNIYQFDAVTGDFIGEFIAPRNNGLADPDTLLYGPDINGDGFNDLYIASGPNAGNSGSFGASSVLVYDGVSGSFIKALVKDNPATPNDETGGLYRPYGIAFGPDGNLYVSSFRSDQILRYNGTTGAFIDIFAQGNGTANGLNGPNGLLFIGDQLYVTTQGSVADGLGGITFLFNSQVLRYDLANPGVATVFANQPTPDPVSFGFVSFLGLEVGPDGDLYVSDFANGVRRYSLATGALLGSLSTNYTGTTPSSNFIGNLAFGPTGDLYVAGFNTNTEVGAVIRYDGSSGSPVDPFSLLVQPNSRQRSVGLTFTPDQASILVGNTRGDNIYQFNATTGEFIRQFIDVRSGGLADPDKLLYGPDITNDGVKDLYVSSGPNAGNSGSFGASSVLVYDGVSGSFIKALVKDNPATPNDETGGLYRPYGIAFGPDGNLYVSSFRSDQILRYNGTTGAFIDIFAQGNGTANGLNGPNGLLFIGDQLYVTTQGSVADGLGGITFLFNSQVLRYDLANPGVATVFADQPTPDPVSFGFVSFLGLEVGPDGDLYVSDFANGVRRYSLATGALLGSLSTNYTGTTPSSNFIGNLAFGPTGDLYVAGFNTNTEVGAVIRYDGSSGSPVDPFSLLVQPNSRQRSVGLTLPPLVNISLGDTPTEVNTKKGSFKLKLREAAPLGGLLVNYQLGGTATKGDDYELAAGLNLTNLTTTSFTIAAGATEAILEVLPVNDTIVDPGETVQLTLLDGPGYTIPGASTTTLTIADNDGIPITTTSNGLFTIGGSNQSAINLAFSITSINARFVNELGVFLVDDDQGTINGLTPGQTGYLKAALGKSQVIASALSTLPNGVGLSNLSRILSVSGNSRLVFYLVSNSTTDAILSGSGSESSVILGPTFGGASFRQVQLSQTGDGFTLNWEDQPGGGDRSFGNLVVNLQVTNQAQPTGTGLQGQSQGEVLDLRSLTGSTTATFTVSREAAFNNFVGFYPVLNLNGGIDTNGDGIADVLPGAANYAVTALQQRIAGIDLTTTNQTTTTITKTLPGGSILAPFIIANGTPDLLLDANTSNEPAIYFPFLAANPGQVDHIRLLGDNIFGFEDLPNGGDFDYNDIVVRVALG